MVVSSSYEFPVLDALVAVHYDNLSSDDFVRKEIFRRKMLYRFKNKLIYNLSTLCDVKVKKNYFKIGSLTGSLERNYDLGSQLVILANDLRKRNNLQTIEVIGVSWWICVDATKEYIGRYGYQAEINYGCTDLVYDYKSLSSLRKASINGKGIPSLSSDVLLRYGTIR